MPDFDIRAITDADRAWIKAFSEQHWGSDQMISRGLSYAISRMPGYIATLEGQAVGLVTYQIHGAECEITSLNSLREGQGIGLGLIEVVKTTAGAANCRRLFVTTTNDNIDALRFYQRHGFVMAALRPGAVNESRRLKPEIPPIGYHGIPIRDEIELEIDLSAD